MALYKNQQYKTGGGPPPKERKLDAVEEILIKIVNENTVNGFLHGSAFDSDDGGPVAKIQYEDHEKNDDTIPTNVQEYEYGSEDFSTFAQDYDMNDIPALSEVQSQRCPPCVLQGPIHHKLKVQPLASKSNVEPQTEISSPVATSSKKVQSNTSNMLSSNRRRPMSGIRALTSSDVAEKYNLLLDKRLVLVQKQIEESAGIHNFNIEEQKLKMKILKQQENLSLEKEERILKIELLKTDLKYKKCVLSSSS